MPLGDRVVVLRVVSLAFRVRPAVVVARLDRVQLVPGVLAELRGEQALFGVPGEALHIAVAIGVHRGVRERVARCRVALRGQPQDLAAEGLLVLGQAPLTALARTRVQHAVRAEGDAAAVVDVALGDALEDGVGRPELLAGGLLGVVEHAGDAVVRGGGEVRVDHVVGGVVRESVMPRRPPSPAADTPDTLPSSVFLPVASVIRVIVPSSREETRRFPSGSGARPQGTSGPR